MTNFYAVIEAGGTKFNCAIMDEQRNIIEDSRVATDDVETTLSNVVAFFMQQRQQGRDFKQLGLACFGPLDLDPQSEHFGSITETPKPGWQWTPIKNRLADALDCEVIIETDVNAAALAEYRWGASQGTDVSVYVTIGTGVGGGVVINGKPLHGLVHPEIGHMQVPNSHSVKCACPYHNSCVEGLASGSAIKTIWQQPAETLADDHQAWQVAAEALAQMCHNLLLTLSPQKIILGGGVMVKDGMLARVIELTETSLNRYLCSPQPLNKVIDRPALGGISGLYGALALLI